MSTIYLCTEGDYDTTICAAYTDRAKADEAAKRLGWDVAEVPLDEPEHDPATWPAGSPYELTVYSSMPYPHYPPWRVRANAEIVPARDWVAFDRVWGTGFECDVWCTSREEAEAFAKAKWETVKKP